MVKKTALFLTMVLILSAFCGCSNKDNRYAHIKTCENGNYKITVKQTDTQLSSGVSMVKVVAENRENGQKEEYRTEILDNGGLGQVNMRFVNADDASVTLSGSKMQTKKLKVGFDGKIIIYDEKDELLRDLEIYDIHKIDYAVTTDDTEKEIKITNMADLNFLKYCNYKKDFPIDERLQELFLLPVTKHLKITFNFEQNEKNILILEDGSIVFETAEDEQKRYKVYQTQTPDVVNRQNFGEKIKKYGGYFDSKTN